MLYSFIPFFFMMELKGNDNTYTLFKQNQIDEHVNTIGKWIHDVNGHNSDAAIEFIFKYLHHLNDNTKKSLYEHILNITDTELIDINKKNDLIKLIDELVELK